jgi:hypothetical protein
MLAAHDGHPRRRTCRDSGRSRGARRPVALASGDKVPADLRSSRKGLAGERSLLTGEPKRSTMSCRCRRCAARRPNCMLYSHVGRFGPSDGRQCSPASARSWADRTLLSTSGR